MITIKVRDFRGAERADIACAPIGLVAGLNAAGKSSIAQAVGAALTGRPIPIEDIPKGSAAALVHVGSADGIVEVTGESGTSTMAWPMGRGATSGDGPPRATAWAAGLDSVVKIDAKDRARVLGEYLKAAPTHEDFASAMRDAGLSGDDDNIIKAMWKLVENVGWDNAHLARKERGAEMKGQWREVTGANYGSKIAAAWHPSDWSDNLEGAAEAELAQELAAAKRQHEAAIKSSAQSEAATETLRREANVVAQRTATYEGAVSTQKDLSAVLETAREDRENLPSAISEMGMPCPHCGAEVVLRRINLHESRLEKAAVIPEAELKKRRDAKAAADGKIGNLEGRLREAGAEMEAALAALERSRAAARLLQNAKPSSGPSVEASRGAAETAERRLNMVRQQARADDLREKIASNDVLLGILAPDGMRQTKLTRTLGLFNSTLASLCETAGWDAVQVDGGMSISYGPRPYGLISASEQYRVQAVLQVAMAQIDGSDMAVFDAAVWLDSKTCSGLLALVDELQRPALICMTMSRRDQLPDLSASEMGASFWIDNGICEQVRLNGGGPH
jgi:hypothetical protein